MFRAVDGAGARVVRARALHGARREPVGAVPLAISSSRIGCWRLVRENNLDPSMVTLELTETAAMQDPAVALDILARLRVKNINLCLDDFGTGASSLTHLYKMPFSEVKLDNQFTNDMRLREDARALVEGLDLSRAQAQDARLRRRRRGRRHARDARGDALRQGARATCSAPPCARSELEARRRELEQPVFRQIAAQSRPS